MNVFDELPSYSEYTDRQFTCEEIASVKEAVVVNGVKGKTIKFSMTSNCVKYLGVDPAFEYSFVIGTVVDIKDLVLRKYTGTNHYTVTL